MTKIHFFDFSENDVPFYRSCFYNVTWRQSYGISDAQIEIDDLLEQNLRSYPYVKRVIAKNHEGRRIGFAVIDFIDKSSQQCCIAGGIDPIHLNKFYGVKYLVALLTYLFESYPIQKIHAKPYNPTSLKILTKLDFKGLKIESTDFQIKQELFLAKDDFPNSMCQRILRKVSYEKK